MPRKRIRPVRVCEWCEGLIGAERGPAAKTCSPECQRDRNNSKERKRYEKVKDTPQWQATRATYLQKLAVRAAEDPTFAKQLAERHRKAVSRWYSAMAADPARLAEYRAERRRWHHNRTPEQRAARKNWYKNLSPEFKRLYLLELRRDRAYAKLKEVSNMAKIEWDASKIALLGTIPDRDLAKKLGVNAHVVRYQREKQNIPPATRRDKLWEPWADYEIDLLGTMPDAELAKKLERTTSSIRLKRVSLGIPTFGKSNAAKIKKATLEISDEMQEKLAELEPYLLQRYIDAGLPIDALHPWQIVEIALNELLHSVRKSQAKSRGAS